MATEESVAERHSFMVKLKPAYLLFRSLGAMQGINTIAVMVVREGNIQFVIRGVNKNVIATLNMEASTVSSTSSDYTIQFTIRTWTQRLMDSIIRQKDSSLLIYKIGTSPNLYCLVGDDSAPIQLEEVVFITEPGIPIKELQAHPVVGYLHSEYFRQVLSLLAAEHDHVAVFFTQGAITWKGISGGELKYRVENGDCYVENVEPETIRYMLMQWFRGVNVLDKASKISDMVEISLLIDPELDEWNVLSFVVDPRNYLCFMMRGPAVPFYIKGCDK